MPNILSTNWADSITFEEKTNAFDQEKSSFPLRQCKGHTSLVSLAKFHELGYKLLPHPSYSPDLAPSDYFLLPNLKKWLGEKRFDSNDEIISQTNIYFEDLDKSYFLEGIKKLEIHWMKCIELKGDYVEK